MPNRHEIDDTLGWIYHNKGLTSLAVATLKQSVKAVPQSAVYLCHLGLAYAQNGDKAEARELLDRALKLDPSFDGAEDARKVRRFLQG